MAIDENEIKRILGQLENDDMNDEFEDQDTKDFFESLGIGFHKENELPQHVQDFDALQRKWAKMEEKRKKLEADVAKLQAGLQKQVVQQRRPTYTPPPQKAARPPKPKGPTFKQIAKAALNKEVDITKLGFKNKVLVKTLIMDAGIVVVGIAGLVYTLT